VAIDTFITDVSRVIKNCADANVRSTTDAALAASAALAVAVSADIGGQRRRRGLIVAADERTGQ
jgi:hypothetical protein